MRQCLAVYALYKGDVFLAEGTVDELAEKFGVKPGTIRFYASKQYSKRTSEAKGRRLVRVE